MKWFDKISLSMLLIPAIFLAIAPLKPEPHLVQKTTMLINGALTKPIDIFDLFMHSIFIMLVIVKLIRMWQLRIH